MSTDEMLYRVRLAVAMTYHIHRVLYRGKTNDQVLGGEKKGDRCKEDL
jgi:hypothetical protein